MPRIRALPRPLLAENSPTISAVGEIHVRRSGKRASMLGRILILGLALFSSTALLPVPTPAIPTSCLPGGFPSAPTPPVVGKDISAGFGTARDRYHIDVWRVSCQDGSGQVALLLRATP